MTESGLEQQLLIANFMTFRQTHSTSVIQIHLLVFVLWWSIAVLEMSISVGMSLGQG